MGKKTLEFVDFLVFATESSLQEFSSHSCGRSAEYLNPPITIQLMVPFPNINETFCDGVIFTK